MKGNEFLLGIYCGPGFVIVHSVSRMSIKHTLKQLLIFMMETHLYLRECFKD